MATPNLTAITTVTPKVLASAQLASGDNASYTVPTSKAAKLAKVVLSNTTAGTVIVSVSVIPSGGTVDSTHRLVSDYSLTAKDSTIIAELEGVWLGAGDAISINSGTATAVDVLISGLEFA